eukprot:TRINITY_DN1632_c3_g1_i3.p1 TRINITY_DN1632_c3_g1~~TRINITY_DN1632_c3_g1_i3.p1  ORF type:complete len:374 (+),score=117.91 TRINITY_DN1632_c3_g1_i3:121-1242(+)
MLEASDCVELGAGASAAYARCGGPPAQSPSPSPSRSPLPQQLPRALSPLLSPLPIAGEGAGGGGGGAAARAALRSVRLAATDKDTRALTLFAALLAVLTVLQLLVGLYSNSLGLIAQAVHSTFDVLSVIITVSAILFGRRPPTYRFSYGYQRFEVLCGFSTSVLLHFLSFFVIVEAVQRLFFPQQVHSHEPVLWMSIITISVDIVGAFMLRERKSGWKSGHGSHGDTFAIAFVHIFGHALLGTGVIISSFLSSAWHWEKADPLVSLGLSVYIVSTAAPILLRTAKLLLQTTPMEVYPQIYEALHKATMLEGVLEVKQEHFWTLAPEVYVGSLCVRVRHDAAEETVRAQVRALFEQVTPNLAVQVEKDQWLEFH